MKEKLPSTASELSNLKSDSITDKIGKFTFIGFIPERRKRCTMIVLNRSGKVIETCSTKMKSLEQMELLFERIKEDRANHIYRSFKFYGNAWVKGQFIKVPEVSRKKLNQLNKKGGHRE